MKRKMVKKIAGCVLAVAMTVSAVPVGILPGVGEGVCALAAEPKVADGFQYIVGDDGTVRITGYTGTNTKVVVPDTIEGKKVTSIEAYAFSGCSSLNEISIPEGVTSIGDGVFCGCLNLKKIELASGN